MQIGPFKLENALALAPMAGVTDRPFRLLCRRFGASFAPSEMITSDTRLWHTEKTRLRLDHQGEGDPIAVQIAGGDPEMIANAARLNVERGAQIIDINLGCPAKKVCRKRAGSWLLNDEDLVRRIVRAAVRAVDVPVTVKTRIGWSRERRNGVEIARIVADEGAAALAVHARTRECRYTGAVDYDMVRRMKAAVAIPVWVNGDIDSAQSARAALEATNADGVMIGRAAQGRPWIFRDIARALKEPSEICAESDPDIREVRAIITGHLQTLYAFYGDLKGVRIARKHIGWYLKNRPDSQTLVAELMRVETPAEQLDRISAYFDMAAARQDRPEQMTAA